jgi:hypothetical protein
LPCPDAPGGKVRAHVEQVILNVSQDFQDIGVLHMKGRNAEDGVGFVNAAVGGHTNMEFRQPQAITEGSLAFIAGTRIDFVEFHIGSFPQF